MVRSREGIKSSNLGGRFDKFTSVMVVVPRSYITPLVSPCALRMAGKSMYEYNAFCLENRIVVIIMDRNSLKKGLIRVKEDCQPSCWNSFVQMFAVRPIHCHPTRRNQSRIFVSGEVSAEMQCLTNAWTAFRFDAFEMSSYLRGFSLRGFGRYMRIFGQLWSSFCSRCDEKERAVAGFDWPAWRECSSRDPD